MYSATSSFVMEFLKFVNQKLGLAIICNLHLLSLVCEYSTRVIGLREGRIVYDGPAKGIDDQVYRQIYGDEARPVDIV